MSRADELQERLTDFSVRIRRVIAALPKDQVGNQLAKQLIRSGTSPTGNYAEACAPRAARISCTS